MKKNLKIVSAAAAALLAVAPVVATGVAASPVVNAAANNEITLSGNKPAVKGDIDITSNLTARTFPRQTNINHTTGVVTDFDWDGNISGTASATMNGQKYTVNLPANSLAHLFEKIGHGWATSGSVFRQVPATSGVYALTPGKTYYVEVDNASMNFGTANANRKGLVIKSSDGVRFAKSGQWSNSIKVDTNQDGATANDHRITMLIPVTAVDVTNARSVSFFEQSTGNEVTSGSLNLTAGATHQLNVQQVLAAFNQKYAAHQLEGNTNSGAQVTTTASDIKDQLTKAGISVDDNGYFTAPEHFSFTVNAKSNANNATASMNVNVNVANGVHTNTPDEYAHTTRVWNKKASYIYNANHQRLANGMLYKVGSGHNVVAENGQPKVYHVGGIDAYKLADGHYKGNYVDVRNFSTSRVSSNKKVVTTRARVFTASGRVVGRHNYVNAGVRVKVSGTKTIKGHKMYRIATNRYIKAANVRNA